MSMKRTNLYLAMVVAVGLVGCGSGSNGTTPTTPTDNTGTGTDTTTTPDPSPATAKGDDFDTLGQNININSAAAKFNEKESQGTMSWIRTGSSSEFELVRDEPNIVERTPGAMIEPLDTLTNIVLAQNKSTTGTKEIFYTGQYTQDTVADRTDTAPHDALQVVNTQMQGGDELVKIQTVATFDPDDLTALQRNEIEAQHMSPTTVALLTEWERNGLVTQVTIATADNNFIAGEESDMGVGGQTPVSQNSETRVFGRMYNQVADSAAGVQNVMNSYSSGGLVDDEGDGNYELTGVVQKLDYVQYGRVTANLNRGDATAEGLQNGYNMYWVDSAIKGSDTAVDVYFQRGIAGAATTVEQMAALPNEGVYKYIGHALMYGIDNSDHRDSNGDGIPNGALGVDSSKFMLGNFVTLEFNLANRTIQNGEVYNLWQDDVTKSTLTDANKDVLVTFSGNVYGNTAIGTADRTYVAGVDNNVFAATFYGDAAEEVGGQFGTPRDPGKTTTVGWGGVFGAKKTTPTDTTIPATDGGAL